MFLLKQKNQRCNLSVYFLIETISFNASDLLFDQYFL